MENRFLFLFFFLCDLFQHKYGTETNMLNVQHTLCVAILGIPRQIGGDTFDTIEQTEEHEETGRFL